ncbi:putative Laccase-14 [Cocos nucifera]|nr:putative Laccase-14 [Cocos nucifera]
MIEETPYTRLCHTKKILTVNGQFPGPTIKARKGDTVIVRVYNLAGYNITLHWHGVDQPRNPWSDGPEYITQCPIQPGANFTYTILFSEEEGTLWWHAHNDWDRATVHGAIIVYPRRGTTFPFPKPYKEIPIILGEWWNANVSEVIADALRTGGEPEISDAYTINGRPGDLYNCSKPGTFKALVEHGKTYLLRVVNAAINNELFFAIAGHRLTVVGTDASYTKPFTTDFIMITPGQTMDLLLEANQPVTNSTNNRYYMAASAYASAVNVTFDNTTTAAILEYINGTSSSSISPQFPYLPSYNDTDSATNFTANLRSLASKDHPVDVPQTIDERTIISVSVNEILCPDSSCEGPNGNRLAASLNNISFVPPPIDVLDAYYRNISGVYGTGFPSQPPFYFNFTGDNLPFGLLFTRKATEVRVLEYNTSLEIVFQGTNILAGENHPMHLHGYSLYVVGRGFGNYDAGKDPASYNLVDPPLENTVGVPKNGWAAIRSSEIVKKWRIGASSAAPGVDLKALEAAIAKKDSNAVKDILDQLSQIGWAKKWSSQPYLSRRTTSLRELTTLGIRNAENLAIPSVRNDAAFLFTVVGVTGFLGVIAGQLPGDWGFFVPYLLGSISLIVLAIGSTSPGLLQAAVGGFSSFFPDYQERIARHEAAHFLVAYLIGLPILGYSLDIGKEHVNLVDESLEKLVYSGKLDDKELDRLAVVSMAGLAAEGLKYDKVVGQSADLFTLQVLFAGSLLKNNAAAYEALMSAMSKKASVRECIEAIENAS